MNSCRLRFANHLLACLLLSIILAIAAADLIGSDVKAGQSSLTSVASGSSLKIWLNGDIVGSHPGWNDTSPGPTITVISGETVTLLLNATDPLTHNWFIDVNNNGVPDPNEISSPDFSVGATKVLSFTFTPVIGQNVPTAGNWTYRCRYHPFPYMYGTIRVVQPDFSPSASPSQLEVGVGMTATSTITVNPLFHFNQTIYLSVTGSNGLATAITPSSLGKPSETAVLTMTASSVGNFTATVVAASGSLSHSLVVTVEVGDFAISADPTVSSSQMGIPVNSAITVTTVNHFAGVLILGSNSTSCSLNPTSLTGPGKSSLTCTFVTSGLDHVLVTGRNGSLSHSLTVVFNVTAPKLADFVVTAIDNSLSLHRSSHTNDVIQLKSIGFSGTITLSLAIGPTGPHHRLGAMLENSSINLPENSSGLIVLRLSARGPTSPGVYLVTVTATNGSLTHSVTITVVVTCHHHQSSRLDDKREEGSDE